MPKDKSNKQPSPKKAAKPRAKATKAKTKASTKRATVTKAVQSARSKAAKIATNPAVAEIVAASLVAAAAAIKDPKKARSMAAAVGDELEAASRKAVNSGSAFWLMALDIARKSIDALGHDSGGRKAKTVKAKAGGKAKAKAGGKKKAKK